MSPEDTATMAIEPKQHFTGRVVKTTMAGALVDLGVGVPGVLHISQVSKEPVNKLEDVLKEGDSVDVWVRRVKDDRVELTMIEPLAYDWKDLKPEMVVKGKVVRLEPYGAFIDFGAERPGMVHVSEMAHGYVRMPGDVVKEGDEVEAAILDVDRRKKQIRLSIKAATAEPEKVEEEPKPERRNSRGDPRQGAEGGRRKPRREKQPKHETAEVEAEPKVAEPTAFELAWQEALERGKKDQSPRPKQAKGPNVEQEDIINRTLEKRGSS